MFYALFYLENAQFEHDWKLISLVNVIKSVLSITGFAKHLLYTFLVQYTSLAL